MTPEQEAEEIGRIWLIASRSLEDARVAFKEVFGVSVDDRSFRAEFARLSIMAFGDESGVRIPTRIALAFVLSEGGAGRGKGDRSDLPRVRRAKQLAVRKARRRKAELTAEGMKAGDAEQKAAQDARDDLQRRGYHPPSLSTIRRKMQSDE